MARMLTQVPLPLLPGDAAEIAPGVGVVAGPDGGGVVWVHGLATFAWDGGADGVAAGQDPAGTDTDLAGTAGAGAAEPEALPVLPDPVPRGGERALARFGLLGEGAAPAFTPGARYPLAGLLLALPPLAQSGLLACARQVYGRLRNGFYGLEVMLVVLVFMALLREARAEGATRIPRPRWAGYWAWTGPRKSRRSAASSASSRPPARPRTCRWRWPATTPRPDRTPWDSCTSTGTPGRTSASGTSRRCT